MKLNQRKFTINLIKKKTADPNSNYTTLCNEILRSKNKHMPSKWVKFNKYKHKKSSWITQGLLVH